MKNLFLLMMVASPFFSHRQLADSVQADSSRMICFLPVIPNLSDRQSGNYVASMTDPYWLQLNYGAQVLNTFWWFQSNLNLDAGFSARQINAQSGTPILVWQTGYTMPVKWAKNLLVSVAGRNLLMLYSASGIDQENTVDTFQKSVTLNLLLNF